MREVSPEMKRSVAELHYPLCRAKAKEDCDGGEEKQKIRGPQDIQK
jgi:hypothetical protein